jgi:hypothetical protein
MMMMPDQLSWDRGVGVVVKEIGVVVKVVVWLMAYRVAEWRRG